MVHINYLKKIPAKILRQLKALKDNGFINNNLYYYLKLTKIKKPGVPKRPIISYSGSHYAILTNT